jgi:Rhodopirellula transposase DDE domain
MIDEAAIRLRWDAVGSRLDERGRRLFAAAEVRSSGRGGLVIVSKITGLARSTINRGKQDLDAQPLPKGQVRRAGGGRRSVCENDPGLVPALKRLVEPATLGDPMRPLIWVSKSMEKLAATLTQMGHPISADTVCTCSSNGEVLPPVGFALALPVSRHRCNHFTAELGLRLKFSGGLPSRSSRFDCLDHAFPQIIGIWFWHRLGPQGRISDARFSHRRTLWESLRFKSAGTCSSE